MNTMSTGARVRPLSTLVRRFFVVWLFLPLIGGVAIISLAGARLAVHMIADTQLDYARSAAVHAERFLDYNRQDLAFVALTLSSGETGPVLGPVAERFSAGRREFNRVILLDREMKLVESIPRDETRTDFSGIVLEAPIDCEVCVTASYYSSPDGQIVVGLVQRVPSGYLLAELNLQTVQSQLRTLSENTPYGFVFLSDRYGNLLSYPEMERVEQQVNLGYLNELSPAERRRLNDTMYRVSAVSLPDVEWIVAVAQEELPLFTPLLIVIGTIFFVSTLLLAILLTTADLVLTRQVVAPLTTFATLVNQVKEGRVPMRDIASVPSAGAGFQELASLYRSFLDMRDAVAKREAALREREQYLSIILDSIGDAVIVTNTTGEVMRVNGTAERLTGWSVDEAVGSKLETVFRIVDVQTGEPVNTPVAEVLSTGMIVGIANHTALISRDGSRYQIADSAAPVRDGDGRVYGCVLVFRDVTHEYRRDAQMRDALRQKEALLKEVHHRVKNNLNVVSSLLSLQADKVESATDAQNALMDSRNRIYSMAIVHESIYKSSDLSRVDMQSYCETLLREVSMVYRKQERVSLKVEVESISLEIVYAVPCGIIINELVTNACKYAFDADETGEIRVTLRREYTHHGGRTMIMLEVSDTGRGFPPEVDPLSGDTLGLQLVSVLTEQLEGALLIPDPPRAVFQIRFFVGSIEAEPELDTVPAPAE